jgi:hypothetical protein
MRKRRFIIVTIKEFVENYKNKNIINTKINPNAISEYIKRELEIKTYIPFREKREIAEMVVRHNIKVADGVKKYDSIDGYIALIVASIMAHTNLEFGAEPIAEYDLLAESELLPQILAEFQGSHEEIDLLLHMVLDMELEDNEISAIIGRFLNKISEILDDMVDITKDKFNDFDLQNIFGADIKPEDLSKLTGLLDKLK